MTLVAHLTTPCIGTCSLDPAGRLCIGCGRTIEEIAAWATLDETARRAIMARLPSRLAAEPPPSRASQRGASR